MTRPSRNAISALAASLALVLALAATAQGAAGIHYTHEGFPAFKSQLASGQIHAVTFNKKAHTVHATLANGGHVLASYPPTQYKAIAAQFKAKGAAVTVEKHKAKSVHHKLRYIAAGVLVVLIVIVVLVLALNRRRPQATEPEPGRPAAGAAPPEPGGPATG